MRHNQDVTVSDMSQSQLISERDAGSISGWSPVSHMLFELLNVWANWSDRIWTPSFLTPVTGFHHQTILTEFRPSCNSSAVTFTPWLSRDDTVSCWKREKALDEWGSECWKHSFCRCQTRAMIAVLSLEAIRNVFTHQPNVALCWVIRLWGPRFSPNIYLFIYFSSVYFSFSAKKKKNRKKNLSLALRDKLIWFGLAMLKLLGMFSTVSRGWEYCARFVRI